MSGVFFRSRRTVAAAVAAGLLLAAAVGAGPAAADDGPPTGFPSWGDVQKAKGNAAATKAEVGKINALLQRLSAESDALGTAAVAAGAKYATTKARLDQVTGEVAVLTTQTTRAEKEATAYQKDVAAIAAQSYKSGGNFGLLGSLATLNSPGGLEGLDMLAQVGQQTADRQVKARDAQSVAAALTRSRQAAQDEQAALTGQAKSELDSAVAAQNAVAAQLAARKTQSNTLTAQLAALNNTSAAVERKYQEGQAALAAYEAAQAAKQKAAEEEAARQAAAQAAAAAQAGGGQSGGGAPAPAPQPSGYIPVEQLLPNIPGGAVNDPAGAQAYAASRLGAYGWSQNQFSCLASLWTQESSWMTNATNPTSGAYGIAQALPPGKYAEQGGDWLTNYRTQIDWGLGYIRNRYGSPCGAWQHEVSMNWY